MTWSRIRSTAESVRSWAASGVFVGAPPLVYGLVGLAVYSLFYAAGRARFADQVVTFEVLFSVAVVSHVVVTAAAVGVVGKALGARMSTSMIMLGLWLLMLLPPTMSFLSFFNGCTTGSSFPIPGLSCG